MSEAILIDQSKLDEATALSGGFEVSLTDDPSQKELESFWDVISNDPVTPVFFTDLFPESLDVFLEPTHNGSMHLWLGKYRDEVVSAHWFHDRGLWGHPDAAWLGAWHHPDFRRKLGSGPQIEANQLAIAEHGIKHIFSAIRVINPASHMLALKIGMKPCGVFPRWVSFGGVLDDVMLYSLRGDDQHMLFDIAMRRAIHHRNVTTGKR